MASNSEDEGIAAETKSGGATSEDSKVEVQWARAIFFPTELGTVLQYRVSRHLADIRLIDIEVGSSGYQTGQQGSYSNGGKGNKCVNKR